MQIFRLHWTNIVCLVPDDYNNEETASFLACITGCVLIEEQKMLEHKELVDGVEVDLNQPLTDD